MNLSVNSVNFNPRNKVSFGMAEFTPRGREYAIALGDVYEPLANPNEFLNPEFFTKKPILGKAPFTKYVKTKLSNVRNERTIGEVKKTILECGTSNNPDANARFVRQLLATSKVFEKLDSDTMKSVSEAIIEVIDRNYDNPCLSDEETQKLVNMGRKNLGDKNYATLTAAIVQSKATI